MKKLSLVLFALVLVLGTLGGCCAVEKKAVQDVEETHKIILPDYLKYVEADPNLKPEQKDDRKKLVESLQRLTDALKKSAGGD